MGSLLSVSFVMLYVTCLPVWRASTWQRAYELLLLHQRTCTTNLI